LDNTTKFAFDSAALTDEGREQLARLAPTLPRQSLSVAGYTDDIGPAEYNDDLALAHRDPGLFAHWRLVHRAAAGQ